MAGQSYYNRRDSLNCPSFFWEDVQKWKGRPEPSFRYIKGVGMFLTRIILLTMLTDVQAQNFFFLAYSQRCDQVGDFVQYPASNKGEGAH